MTTIHFDNYDELTGALVEATIALVRGSSWSAEVSVRQGFSNVSCSAYVEVSFLDDDGDYLATADERETFKLRYSNHGDRYGSDRTVRFEHLIENSDDEDDDCTGCDIEGWRFDDLIAEGFATIKAFHDEVTA